MHACMSTFVRAVRLEFETDELPLIMAPLSAKWKMGLHYKIEFKYSGSKLSLIAENCSILWLLPSDRQ